MKTLAYASLLLLMGAALVIAADPAAACPMPTSGTGLATCEGTGSSVQATTTEGPVCWNALCPGVKTSPSPGTCAQVWVEGDGMKPVCVGISISGEPVED